MPDGLQKTIRSRLIALWIYIRNWGLTVLIVGGIQVLLALLIWPILFRARSLGFSLALSLVGFASWIPSIALSFGFRRRLPRPGTGAAQPSTKVTAPRQMPPVIDQVQAQVERAGCGWTLFVSSIIPLGLAFVMRVQADLGTGKTWREIIPPLP
jgi:hypothetical protein